jgi:hypothetical protein
MYEIFLHNRVFPVLFIRLLYSNIDNSNSKTERSGIIIIQMSFPEIPWIKLFHSAPVAIFQGLAQR